MQHFLRLVKHFCTKSTSIYFLDFKIMLFSYLNNSKVQILNTVKIPSSAFPQFISLDFENNVVFLFR